MTWLDFFRAFILIDVVLVFGVLALACRRVLANVYLRISLPDEGPFSLSSERERIARIAEIANAHLLAGVKASNINDDQLNVFYSRLNLLFLDYMKNRDVFITAANKVNWGELFGASDDTSINSTSMNFESALANWEVLCAKKNISYIHTLYKDNMASQSLLHIVLLELKSIFADVVTATVKREADSFVYTLLAYRPVTSSQYVRSPIAA